jgi:hypothetical protein
MVKRQSDCASPFHEIVADLDGVLCCAVAHTSVIQAGQLMFSDACVACRCAAVDIQRAGWRCQAVG